MSLSVIRPNNRSTWLTQDDPVGVKWTWNRGCAVSQVLISGGLVGGVVVADEVDVQLVGDGLVDGDQELAELDRPVTAVQFGDDCAVGDVERGEQAGDAVADVVVGASLGHAGHHRQHRLGPVQRLDLALLVDAQHHGLLRRVVVEADDVDDLLDEQRVGRQLEPVLDMGFEVELRQIRPMVDVRQAAALGHRGP